MLKEAYLTKQFYSEQPVPPGPYCLSMLISDRSFMYAISTSSFTSVIELCHVEFADSANSPDGLIEQVSFLIQNHFLLQKKFNKVYIAFLNNDFNLVPEAFADESDLKSLLKFTSGVNHGLSLATHQLKGIRFTYTNNNDLVNYIEKTFPSASIRHAGAVNINLLFGQHSLTDSQVFLNINDSEIELAIKEKNELLFYNTFRYQSNEDILYYLLFTMEQFNLNPLHVKLALAAQIPVTGEVVKSIKKYIKHVNFCINDPSLVLNGDLKSLPSHYYFTLLNQHTCGL